MPIYDSPPYTTDYAVPMQDGREGDGSSVTRVVKNGEDRPTSPPVMYNPFFTGRPRTPEGRTSSMDRREIIRKIKNTEPRSTRPPIEQCGKLSAPTSQSSTSQSLSPESKRHADRLYECSDQNAAGLDISRPRSALHSGDFREDAPPSLWRFDGQDRHQATPQKWQPALSTSPVAPWHRDFPKALNHTSPHCPTPPAASTVWPARPRAVSHASLSSSFAYQPPTSPLVHQANAADIPDFEPQFGLRTRHSPDRTRRNTYSPRLLHHVKPVPNQLNASNLPAHHPFSLRRETTLPYQAHQPRRSIGPFNSLPQSPNSGARRPSISDASPLQHAPMVGSYEESILRGRMSTTPSKPLNFVAQIGVLGKGDCKPSLRCPPHVIIPFPAVFYSYSSGLAVDPEPSPYVGMIDLDSFLPRSVPRDGSRKRRRHHSPATIRPNSPTRSGESEQPALQPRRHKQQKARRLSQSPKEPPGGSYRIPQIGQLQIVLKNPNKTAVKLFLVPYDLSDMEPGQKTFIRQRSYSAGPIIDMPISSRNNYGTDRPEASLSSASDPKDRPILRYLIHLHICCPSKDRYYLYQNVRVVFANRVPDGKEKLRSEIQMPEPRYSLYKPGRESNAGMGVYPSALPSPHQRRRSAALPASFSMDPEFHSPRSQYDSTAHRASMDSESYSGRRMYVKSIESAGSFSFPAVQRLPTLDSRPGSRETNDDNDPHDPDVHQSPTSPLSKKPFDLRIRNLSTDEPERTRLTFSRETSRERKPAVGAESLLSMRLRGLDV